MQTLIFSSVEAVVAKLNEEVEKTTGKTDYFTIGEDFFYNDVKCGKFISIGDEKNCLYFGLSPNVFDASVISPQSVIVTDFFSSVAIRKEFVNHESESSLIKNCAEFDDTWVYFPICRKILCCDNFEELYINRVFTIIKNGWQGDM